ncbi:MAG: cardiolipin synthase [Sulfurovum sp.]|nr:cardiolipin synthase [Sulfurovum sp.]
MLWIIVIVAFHFLGLLSTYRAIMDSRTSQGAVAWVIFLITFPYISLPIFWIFGRNKFQGYSRAKELKDQLVHERVEILKQELEPYLCDPSEKKVFERSIEKLAYFPMLKGNSLSLLIDGEATFKSLLEGIAQAEKYILFQFYIVKNDDIGNTVKKALINKAKEGVEVYFLYDEIGTPLFMGDYMHSLEEAGVRVRAFNTRKGFHNKFQINFRNHRKIMVVDGKRTWIGGHNIGDEYLGRSPKIGNWRDTHMVYEGPAVLAAQLSFAEDWHWADGTLLGHLNWHPQHADQNRKILVVPSGSADRFDTAALLFHDAINSAKERIWIASPYFVPDDAIVSALQLAGLRGVDVRILIPERPDNMLVYYAAYTYFEEVSQTGVRFYRYTNGFLHEKVMLIDDEIATIGTANFDNRSFRLNFEITAIVDDKAFASEVEAMFEEDFTHAYEMTMAQIRHKSRWFKFVSRVARLTSPVQ